MINTYMSTAGNTQMEREDGRGREGMKRGE